LRRPSSIEKLAAGRCVLPSYLSRSALDPWNRRTYGMIRSLIYMAWYDIRLLA
jgi:hypothetical protein